MDMDRLPQDALVAILSRLAPRSLAASRCVCKEWRATVDARCNLRKHLLPLSLGGIFVDLSYAPAPPAFFARPSMERKIAGKLESYVATGYHADFMYIQNICNGLLLLCGGHVVNPATRQWASLPPSPPTPDGLGNEMYIVFDPTVSPYYEVLSLPYVPGNFGFKGDLLEGTSWPPSPCIIQVFSSRTWRWEQRSFILEGEAAGTIADLKSSSEPCTHRHAVFWRQTLYVHCKGDFLMRLKLSDDNYQVIKLPMVPTGDEYDQLYLGKSKNGVYLERVNFYQCRLQIWFLHEFDHKTEWILKNSMNLEALSEHYSQNYDDRTTGHWILQDGNYDDENKEPIVETNFDWNSDDDNALNIKDWDPEGFCGYHIFGFHPYKEIIFLYLHRNVLAYHSIAQNTKIWGCYA